jgi:hypothetical protein
VFPKQVKSAAAWKIMVETVSKLITAKRKLEKCCYENNTCGVVHEKQWLLILCMHVFSLTAYSLPQHAVVWFKAMHELAPGSCSKKYIFKCPHIQPPA